MSTRNWTLRRAARAGSLLRQLADKCGGFQAIADALGIEKRATVHAWYTRRRVPIDRIDPLIILAERHGLTIVPSDLAPITERRAP